VEPEVPLPSNNELSVHFSVSSATFLSCCSKIHFSIIVCLHLDLPTDTFHASHTPRPSDTRFHYVEIVKPLIVHISPSSCLSLSHPDINSCLLSRSHRTTGDTVPLCLVFVACLSRLDSYDDSRLVSLLPLCLGSEAD